MRVVVVGRHLEPRCVAGEEALPQLGQLSVALRLRSKSGGEARATAPIPGPARRRSPGRGGGRRGAVTVGRSAASGLPAALARSPESSRRSISATSSSAPSLRSELSPSAAIAARSKRAERAVVAAE